MSSFYFKAMASDGKLRTGTLAGESDKAVARELRKQGLTPVYVGVEQKQGFELKLPEFTRGKHRDILFFTQELSTLLNAGVPLDRALSITSELTEGPRFRGVVLDILRVLKGGRSLADSLAAHPEIFRRSLRQHGPGRRGERSAGRGLRPAGRIRAVAR